MEYQSNVPWILKRNIFVCGTLLSYHVTDVPKLQSATGRLFYGGKFIFNISGDRGYKNKFE